MFEHGPFFLINSFEHSSKVPPHIAAVVVMHMRRIDDFDPGIAADAAEARPATDKPTWTL